MYIERATQESNKPEYVMHMSEQEMMIVRSMLQESLPVLITASNLKLTELLQLPEKTVSTEVQITALNRNKDIIKRLYDTLKHRRYA
jgi:hypothetical protein